MPENDGKASTFFIMDPKRDQASQQKIEKNEKNNSQGQDKKNEKSRAEAVN
jgi:hypothetical protein